MPLVCIHCALRALLDSQEQPIFDETVEDHLRRLHPDPAATARERAAMERELSARLRTPSPKVGRTD